MEKEIPYLTMEERKRMATLLEEISDFFNAITIEIQNEKAYKSYLREKMKSINTDINCINSLLER